MSEERDRRQGEVKMRSVLIARGQSLRVYGSVETVPEPDRGEVDRVLRSHRVLTVLIADKEGKERLPRENAGLAERGLIDGEKAGPDGGVMQALALCGVGALIVWAIATLL
jgi:hypothetical protein